MDVDLIARRLEALGNPTRLRICMTLANAGAAGLSVRLIQKQNGLASASTLSHHLARLVAVGLVSQERQSTTLICRSCGPAWDMVVRFLSEARPNDGARDERPETEANGLAKASP